jgi:hypothetical protein
MAGDPAAARACPGTSILHGAAAPGPRGPDKGATRPGIKVGDGTLSGPGAGWHLNPGPKTSVDRANFAPQAVMLSPGPSPESWVPCIAGCFPRGFHASGLFNVEIRFIKFRFKLIYKCTMATVAEIVKAHGTEGAGGSPIRY